MTQHFDIIVVGGGHAGTEAAAAAARMGCQVALISFLREQIGAMSCNPAIGGLGKGHLVREVDAFDGLIARAADASAIHYRMLNRSKGSAVWGPRVQADRRLYKAAIHKMLAAQQGLHIIEGEVAALQFDGAQIAGVELADGSKLHAEAVILATGTFLGGKLFRGEEILAGGRTGEPSALRLAQQIRGYDLPMARLKTGTPPRIDGRTIDWASLSEQPSDAEPWTMSPMNVRRTVPQSFCSISRTTARTHDIIRANLDRSPLFSGAINAQGPRYCPSIEDKIHRFADRDSHQVFLEPEGLDTIYVYPNGISTSLPADVQLDFVRSMEGMASAEIIVPGYAVEYDHIDPRALDSHLQVRDVPGLYCAGQINGTTGYEEAAAQGLIAGLGAACAVAGAEFPEIDRANSYMAVMIDDLVLQGVTEPYRMLTARAEHRLLLRAENATTRLTPLGLVSGCIGDARREWFKRRMDARDRLEEQLSETVQAEVLRAKGIMVKAGSGSESLYDWLRFPVVAIEELAEAFDFVGVDDTEVMAEVEEDARYAPYLERQASELKEVRANERIALPSALDYAAIAGLSNEMVERLNAAKPETLAGAGRIRGVTPAALAAILVHVKRRSGASKAA